MFTLIYICFSIVCSILSFGLNFAYWQRSYPEITRYEYEYENDLMFSLFMSMIVFVFPFVIVVVFCCTSFGKYGFKYN